MEDIKIAQILEERVRESLGKCDDKEVDQAEILRLLNANPAAAVSRYGYLISDGVEIAAREIWAQKEKLSMEDLRKFQRISHMAWPSALIEWDCLKAGHAPISIDSAYREIRYLESYGLKRAAGQLGEALEGYFKAREAAEKARES